jgi:hypothetical protein
MGSELIVGRLAGGVDWILLAQDRDRLAGSCEYGDEPARSGTTDLVTCIHYIRFMKAIHSIPLEGRQNNRNL